MGTSTAPAWTFTESVIKRVQEVSYAGSTLFSTRTHLTATGLTSGSTDLTFTGESCASNFVSETIRLLATNVTNDVRNRTPPAAKR